MGRFESGAAVKSPFSSCDLSGDERALSRAIENGDIYPVFQPIVSLPSGAISGFEVLARWHNAELTLVPPQQFIQAAERAGMIGALTANLIQTACKAACLWGGQFKLSFNISPLQFQDAGLPSLIETAVQSAGFPLSRVQLEITESALIDDLDNARQSITQLKNLGMSVALDDFGTGFSSLTRLQALPFDSIKIDASFVRTMVMSRDARKIVSAVIGLGQSLGMPVVAEGIETRAEASMLSRLGCDFGQGYLYGRPSHAEAVPAFLRTFGEQTDDHPSLNLSCNLRIAQLNAIYAGAPFALCFVDLKRRYVSANKKFAELIGVHLEHIIGRRVDEVCPHALPFVIADLKAAMNGRRPPPLESVTPDGNRIILSTIAAAHDENNEVVGISVALIDITKYKTSIPMRAFGRRRIGKRDHG